MSTRPDASGDAEADQGRQLRQPNPPDAGRGKSVLIGIDIGKEKRDPEGYKGRRFQATL